MFKVYIIAEPNRKDIKMKKITKTAKIDFIRNMLETNADWAKRALIRIYDNQTSDEQNDGVTVHHNGIGFTAIDANILTSFAEGLKKYGNLTVKQMSLLHSKIGKYAKQIYEMTDDEKLVAIMEKAK
jgi:hypothetical protein